MNSKATMRTNYLLGALHFGVSLLVTTLVLTALADPSCMQKCQNAGKCPGEDSGCENRAQATCSGSASTSDDTDAYDQCGMGSTGDTCEANDTHACGVDSDSGNCEWLDDDSNPTARSDGHCFFVPNTIVSQIDVSGFTNDPIKGCKSPGV